MRDAMLLPLYCHEDEERYDFWGELVGDDLIATILRMARGTIDLRAFIESPTYTKGGLID